MTLFEYIAIAFSMIFSFIVLRLVGALPYAVKTTRCYWPQVLFMLSALIYVLNAFWAFWSYAGNTWTYGLYLLALASPLAQYLTVAILVPEKPAKLENWQGHFEAVRVRFYLGMLAVTLTGALSTTFLAQMAWDHPARIGQSALVVISLIGLVSAQHRIHILLSVLSLSGVLVFGALVLSRPGALA